jgi:hypothetical protein
MPDERLRIPVHPDYASAIGLAVYCFASLEWDAVWCCEAIERGSVDGLEDRNAGREGDTLFHLVKRLDSSAAQRGLEDGRLCSGSANRKLDGNREPLEGQNAGVVQTVSAPSLSSDSCLAPSFQNARLNPSSVRVRR